MTKGLPWSLGSVSWVPGKAILGVNRVAAVPSMALELAPRVYMYVPHQATSGAQYPPQWPREQPHSHLWRGLCDPQDQGLPVAVNSKTMSMRAAVPCLRVTAKGFPETAGFG